jgi:predicted MFS family arabinose efflux permease
MFPIMVPERLWSRVNAIDSNGYLAATLIGPPIAAAMVQFVGGPFTLILIGVLFAIAAVVLVGTREPASLATTSGSLLRDSWEGLVYTWRNQTIRGLGLVMFALNLGGGVLTIVIPIIALNRLHEGAGFVGAALALAGAFGIVTGLWFGRLESRGREKGWLIWSAFGSAVAVGVLLVQVSVPSVLLCMAITGLCNGPLDIGLFTLRQRRTDPAWMGRAIAVSASLNFSGFPIGSAISGSLVERSLEITIVLGVLACLLGTWFAATQIPSDSEAAPSLEPAA